MRSKLIIAVTWLGLIGTAFGQTIVLDNFNSGTASGAVLNSTTWVGNVTQNSTSITINSPAKDDNGWGKIGFTPFDATGMNYVQVIGWVDVSAGHDTASSFTIQFEDSRLRTQVFSISTSVFNTVTSTLVQIPIPGWTSGFDPTQITGWTIGGGTQSGILPYRMTLENLAMSATSSAIPEPATYALLGGLLSLGTVTVWRIRRRARPGASPAA